MKKLGILVGSLALLLVLGAGCDTTDTPQAKPAAKDVPQETSIPTSPPADGDIRLTAEARGANTVNFEWTPSKQLEDLADGWRIVYGEEENPTYPSNWWFERSVTYRDKLWKGLPAGDAHFRVCALVDDECSVYSNDVFVTIEGIDGPKTIGDSKRACEKDNGIFDEETGFCFIDEGEYPDGVPGECAEGSVWEEEYQSCFEAEARCR